ncbi:SprT-like family-domain-containing protein [Aspergillus bertholletiae]|uniref:SprT-like family-domain-containing protein n=1 Tax=Aspergillus bertholletiae TaxID=1226010 RepID=A0A5N7BCX0_9EURO|nr:SprT-like family-domain-containing protein [Aspergillus bertholletiae]
MARLNPASPVKQGGTRDNVTKSVRKLKPNTNSVFASKFRDTSPTPKVGEHSGTLFDEPEFKRPTAKTTTNDKPVQRQRKLQRSGTVSSGTFNIFSDSDGLSDTDDVSFASTMRSTTTISSTEGRTSDPLQLARANSLLMPQSRHSRSRSTRKSELYDYTKENYPVEEVVEDYSTTSSISRNPSDASSTRRSPTRREPRQTATRRQNGRQFRDYRQPAQRSEDEESDDEFNSLDDFIVSDNDEPSHHEASASDLELEAAKRASSPPRVKRRLVRGRRLNPEEQIKKALESSMHTNLRLEPSLPAAVSMPSSDPQASPRKLFRNTSNIGETANRRDPEDDADVHNDAVDHDAADEAAVDDEYDPSAQLQQDLDNFLGAMEPSSQILELKKVNSETPPASPSRSTLKSPSKGRAHIPPTPYRESVDAFWSQEATHNWIDTHSPRKLQNLLQELDESDNEADPEIMPRSKAIKKAAKPPSKTALKKAEAEKKKAVLERKKSFDNKKAAVAEDFFKVLDDRVTGGRIQEMAEETGGVQIIWSKTLQTTAGRANWKREKLQTEGAMLGTEPRTPGGSLPKHHASIELAERIIDDEDRLLNTLAHEYCHLANFIISNVHNNPHGNSFKQWGLKCKEALKDHPVYGGRFEVTTKHSYKIDYKYVWSCVDCGQTYGRHSRSIDTTKSRCGKCKGLLQQIKPKPRNVSPRKKQPLGDVETAAVDEVANVLGEISLRN